MVSAETAARAQSAIEREDLLDQAIFDGRIPAGLRAHYAQCFDADPAGTRAYLAKLGAAATPTAAPAESDAYPASALTSAERTSIEAARSGRRGGGFMLGGL